jgi:hypothetical protein
MRFAAVSRSSTRIGECHEDLDRAARNSQGAGNKHPRRQVFSVATAQSRGGWRRKHVRQQARHREVNIDNFACTPKELTVKAGTASAVGTKGEFHSKALDTDDSSPSPRREPTTILAACIRKCRAGSWSRREARRIIESARALRSCSLKERFF